MVKRRLILKFKYRSSPETEKLYILAVLTHIKYGFQDNPCCSQSTLCQNFIYSWLSYISLSKFYLTNVFIMKESQDRQHYLWHICSPSCLTFQWGFANFSDFKLCSWLHRAGYMSKSQLIDTSLGQSLCFVWLVRFYSISTFVGNLMSNPFLHK